MKKNPVFSLFVVFIVLFLGGCSGVKETLGLTREVPDEFEISSHNVLEIPSDEPVRVPGSFSRIMPRIYLDSLFVEESGLPPVDRSLTPGEQDFLKNLQITSVPDIRLIVDTEANILPSSTQQKVKEFIVFWKTEKKKPAKVISAEDEKKRLEKHGIPT